MPPLFWLLACVYLIVAATTLLEVKFRPVPRAWPATATLCVFALLYAASWPIRVARGALRRLGLS